MSLLDEWLGGDNDPNEGKRILSEEQISHEERRSIDGRNVSTQGPLSSHGHDNADDPHSTSDPILPSDLLLPTDLPLPDIKWWVDLEFLDLASGPPANVGSHMQEKNKNKNPTLDYHFPDIFFDTTSSFADIGDLAIGRNFGGTGGSVTAGGLMGGDQLDPERDLKGLLADLFPPASAVSGAEVAEVGPSGKQWTFLEIHHSERIKHFITDMGNTIIPNPCILGGDHHSDEVTEESAVSEAAEKLLGFDLPGTNTTHNENDSTQIRYDTRFSLI